MSTNRVYVNNLPYSISEDSLKEFFSKIGAVTAVEIFTGYNGRSKGCALVTYESEADATRAIAELKDQDLEGRPLHIREDRGEAPAREARPPRTFPSTPAVLGGAPRPVNNGSRMPPQRPDDAGRKIYVGNLNYRSDWQNLKDLFRDCGEVIRADVAKFPDGRSRGFGTVVFTDAAGATAAIEQKHDTELDGRVITVRLDRGANPQ